MHFESVPLSLAQANSFVAAIHRHHDPVHRDKFRVGCAIGNRLVGVVQVGRPVARGLDDGKTLEVVRLCTDGTKDACSYLYGKAARIAAELGYTRIVTYILASEPGTSLDTAGWHFDCITKGGDWSCQSRPRNTTAPQVPKKRYSKTLMRADDDKHFL